MPLITSDICRFESWADLHEYAKDLTSLVPDNLCDMAHAEALQIANAGGHYDKLQSRVTELTTKFNGKLRQSPSRSQLQRHYSGHRANVPAYLSGAPKSMQRAVKQPVPTRIIRVAFHPGRAGDVTADQLTNRGVAIISALASLESAGTQIELDIVWKNTTHCGASYSIILPVKQAGACWSPTSVAFALATQGFQRRLIWSVIESIKQPRAKALCRNGYGSGIGSKFPGYDLSFAWLADGGAFDTPGKAFTRVKSDIEKQQRKG